MKAYDIARVRSLALIGQGGGGKTTLAEAILFNAGVVDRLGSIIEGTTAMDFEPEEIKRNISINSAICTLGWRGHKIHLIDTPGYSDFLAETKNCLRVVGGAVVVLPAIPEVKVQTENLWNLADKLGIPRLIFITMMDRERANFLEAVRIIDEVLNARCLPLQIPIGSEQNFQGVVDLISTKAYLYKDDKSGQFVEGEIPAELMAQAGEMRTRMMEMIAESDDALIEKYLERGGLSEEEIRAGLRAGVLACSFTPVLVGSGLKNIGISQLLDMIAALLPSPLEEKVATGRDEDAPLSALVFKTVVDPFAGKLSIFRVYSGKVMPDTQVYNPCRKSRERIGQVFQLEGKRQRPLGSAGPGDIAAVAKLKETATGDTLCDERSPIILDFIAQMQPIISFAIEPRTKADEDKMSGALARLQEEDPVIKVYRQEQTKELIISGLGQMHLEAVVEKMKRKFGVDVNLKLPKVPYKETIRSTSRAQGKYKRQTGGRGQYGDTWLEISPLPRGAGFEFIDSIVGGVIPKNYIPAVEKGVVEAMQEGVLAGYPVADIRINLYDGSYHPVDSSDMAFKIAGSIGFKKAFMDASPVLLEPIMAMEIIVPEDKLGEVIGDINSRRGRVLAVEPRGNNQVIRAHVPMAEVLRYASDLRSMTSDRGEFSMDFSHYEEVPPHLAEKIIAESKAQRGER